MLILFILFVIVTELTPYDKNVSTDTDDTKTTNLYIQMYNRFFMEKCESINHLL